MTIQRKATKQHCLVLLLRCKNWFQSLILETKLAYGVSTHIRALERHFPVGLLITLHVETIQMKATEQYFALVLFITLHMVVLTFESVDETLKCDYSNESY